MRRPLLLAAAVLVPLAVVAAINAAPPGEVVELDNYNAAATPPTSYINAAQCAETSPLPLNLEWSTKVQAGGGDSYQLYASSAAPPTTGDTANLCAKENIDGSDGAADVFAGPIAGGGIWTSNIQRGQASGAEAVAKAGRSCTDNQVVYICAHLLDGGTANPVGYASGKFIVQVTAPEKPTAVVAGPANETSLHVTWAPPASGVQVDHYVAVATDANGAVFRARSEGTSATISGLTEGTAYSVVVYAYSLGGNESPPSDPASGTPGPVHDFWETYVVAGGTDDGGCASGAAGPLALLGVASLLLLRRRR